MKRQLIGYVRVSTFDQNPERQLEKTESPACDPFKDKSPALIPDPFFLFLTLFDPFFYA